MTGRLREGAWLHAMTLCIMATFIMAGIMAGSAKAQSAAEPPQPVVLRADVLSDDRASRTVTAEGNVELVYGPYRLQTDRLVYEEDTGLVKAEGNVTLIEPGGSVVFADDMTLRDDLRDGVAHALFILLSDDSRLAAVEGERYDGDFSVLRKAVYSPCDLCPDKPPLWQIKAQRVIHSQDDRTIRYENAFLEFFGIPVAWTPLFEHPDPSVRRKTGLLTPEVGSSSDLGAEFEAPLFVNLAPNYDFTFNPRVTSRQGVLWKGEWRHRINAGKYSLNGAGIFPRRATAAHLRDNNFRGSLSGTGELTLAPDRMAGFHFTVTTDDTFRRRFNLSNDTNLTSRAWLSDLTGLNAFELDAWHFKSLLPNENDAKVFVVAPLANYDYVSPGLYKGGRITARGNLMALTRREGTDSRRLSGSVGWSRSLHDAHGSLYRVFGDMRGDLYDTEEDAPPETGADTSIKSRKTRLLPMAGISWRFPLIRENEEGYQILEPVVQVLLAANGGNPDGIPNEDSQSFEFDDTNLFSTNRYTGLDRREGGKRINAGFRMAAQMPGGGRGEALIGQVFRSRRDPLFPETSGLSGRSSDYVGRLALEPWTQLRRSLRIEQRFRIHRQRFSFRRNEIDINIRYDRMGLDLGYVNLDETITDIADTQEEMRMEGFLDVSRHWRLGGSWRRDLEQHRTIRNGADLTYTDECFQFALSFGQDFTRDRDVEPERRIQLRFAFKNLGGSTFRAPRGGLGIPGF